MRQAIAIAGNIGVGKSTLVDSWTMSDVLVLDTDNLDYIHDLVHRLAVMQRIEAMLPTELGKPACC